MLPRRIPTIENAVARVTIFKPVRCNECDGGVGGGEGRGKYDSNEKKARTFVAWILAMFYIVNVCLFNIVCAKNKAELSRRNLILLILIINTIVTNSTNILLIIYYRFTLHK